MTYDIQTRGCLRRSLVVLWEIALSSDTKMRTILISVFREKRMKVDKICRDIYNKVASFFENGEQTSDRRIL